MDQELKMRLDAQDEKLAGIYKSVEATRKYFKWTMIITIALFILPLFGLFFAIPSFLSAVAPDTTSLGL
jgi:hypothetical protein